MREIVVLNEVPVEILYYGGISPSQMLKKPIKERPKDLVMFIPGNPGIIEVYSRFGDQLYQNLKIPLWLVGYGGYSRAIALPKQPKYNRHLYAMEAQVSQKKQLIFEYLEGVSICLIAHSYGCAMALECLKDETLAQKVSFNYFIFPLFQEFDELPEVPRIYGTVNSIQLFVARAECIVKFLFQFERIRVMAANLIVLILSRPKSDAAPEFMDVNAIRCFVFNVEFCLEKLAGKPYTDLLKKYATKIKIWCSKGDKWQKENFRESIKKDAPEIWIEYNTLDIPHNFQKTHSGQTADALSEMVLTDLIARNKNK